jgi:hypothetical protein
VYFVTRKLSVITFAFSCAGSISSQILQLSGIGPAACCSSIDVVQDLPGVGANEPPADPIGL